MKGGKREGAGKKKFYSGECKCMSIYIPVNLVSKLEKKSKEKGLTVSKLVVNLIGQYFPE